MTKKQLQEFINTRNESPHSSNFQFETDMVNCGLSVGELGDPHAVDIGWAWDTEFGVLIENTQTGRMHLA